MGNPKHQHYIPRSYLKKFAEKKDDQYWVDTLLRGENSNIQRLTTKNICTQKNLYTFPIDTPGDRFALEKFYAEEVDSIYPQVYQMLINPNVVILPLKRNQKYLIQFFLFISVHQYF